MKRVIITGLVLSLFTCIFLPLIVIRGYMFFPSRFIQDDIQIRVKQHTNGKIIRMPLEEYVKGVVAAEVPYSFHPEALKAQAVAARTYVFEKVIREKSIHVDADICTDPSCCQAWISKTALRLRWGFWQYLRNWLAISSAVESTRGLVLTYEGNIVDAVYHSTSGGRTEDAFALWGVSVPYLISVDSPFEDHSPFLRDSKEFSILEIEKKLDTRMQPWILENSESEGRVIQVIQDLNDDVIKVLSRSDTGRIDVIKIGDRVYKGTEVRELLGLRSTLFSYEMDLTTVRFYTIGYGHGVGMSQYGADGLGRRGYHFNEILKHYYQGAEIKNITDL